MKGFMRMKEALVDISVLLIFFTRHEQFAQVFEQVRKAKPSRLFLYQDGPRPGRQDDIINIKNAEQLQRILIGTVKFIDFIKKKTMAVIHLDISLKHGLFHRQINVLLLRTMLFRQYLFLDFARSY